MDCTRVPKYDGSPAEKFFAALQDAKPDLVLQYLRENRVGDLVNGLLMRIGLAHINEAARTAYIEILRNSQALCDTEYFQSPRTFLRDVQNLRRATLEKLQSIRVLPQTADQIIASAHSKTLPGSA